MDTALRRIVFVVVLATMSQLVDSSCYLNTLVSTPCRGKLRCIEDFSEALHYVRSWQCRKHERYDYNYGYRRTQVDEDYILYVEGENIGDELPGNMFSVINELSDNIYTLSITNSNFTTIPSSISNLKHATTVDLSQNSIEALNLKSFARASFELLNVSFNVIANLETEETSPFPNTGKLSTIDMSYNEIELIPNNYFRLFPELRHLNLSHNLLATIEILTFEGITQLETLYMSNNKLSKLGVYFARFVNLKELFLDQNYLTSIEESNFNMMTHLETLNASSNRLKSIDPSSFANLIQLTKLDLSNNEINMISKILFQNNSNLVWLDLSNNKIAKLDPGSFQGKAITFFKIDSNMLTGFLDKNTFQGINMEELDLSGAKITELGPELFVELNDTLQSLNFSNNIISKIHKTTFSKLELLSSLDLSRNNLQNIDFDMKDLKNLSYFFINDNSIKKITRDMLRNVTSLRSIDLSNNSINDIETLVFENFSELETLNLNDNPLPSIIPSQMFTGLTSCFELHLTNTKINTLQNNAFNGMISLNVFNISRGDLNTVEYNVFNGTGSIVVLDLSYNKLETFSTNNANIKLVEKISLNHNKLQHVSSKMFSGLNKLLKLDLAFNNILSIDNEAFNGLRDLVILDLSVNKNMAFNSSVFSDTPSLAALYLHNVSGAFNFENMTNTSISGLDISFCDIIDINSVQVYRIKTLEILTLTNNNIRFIDKSTFQQLHYVTYMGLGFNRISNIQPGSFIDTEKLSILKLNNNFLSSLQFGVLDGLVNLEILDLSNNVLHTFEGNLFHNTPNVRLISLDDNMIDDIDFDAFAAAKVKQISIGGNSIPCSKLANVKKPPFTTIHHHHHSFESFVTAQKRNYDTENINGISCRSINKLDNITRIHGNESALTVTLVNTIEEFRVTIENFLNRNDTKIDFDSIALKEVSESIGKLLESFNKSESTNSDFLAKLTSINNNTNSYLENIQRYLKERKNASNEYNLNDLNSKLTNDDVEKMIVGMLDKQKDSLKNEFKSMFVDWKSHDIGSNHFQPQTATASDATDLKSALYFIATCLAALLVVMVLSFIFIYFKFRNKLALGNGLYSSRQPISNVMEME